jgi:anaerobic selenocysteine-containing dehydrogenase
MNLCMPLYQGIGQLKAEGDQLQWGGARLCANGFPNMPEGRARFSLVKLPRIDVPVGKFLLTSRRGKQFNSITYGQHDPLTQSPSRSTVLVDERDLASLGLRSGDPVWVKSDYGQLAAHAKAGPCQHHHVQAFWPECNVLIRPNYDAQSGEPDYNTPVSIERRTQENASA